MQPLVSILIPVFNRANFIGECIESALSQTYTNVEVVVVDNASTDETWNICKKYADIDQRVQIFRNKSNIGPVNNWICCAQKAKGYFTKILFSDDCLDANCLTEMLQPLNDPDVAFVYCAARIGKTREKSTIAYAQPDSMRIDSIEYVNLVLSGMAPVSPGAVLLRKYDLIKNLHGTFPTSTAREFEKNGAGPDVMIMLLTANNYPYVARISTPLVFFRAHNDSFTVANKNNYVVKGYRSAIAFFLKNTYGNKMLLSYLSYCWLQQIKSDHSWLNPADFIMEYECSGCKRQILLMMIYAVKHIVCKFFRRLYFA